MKMKLNEAMKAIGDTQAFSASPLTAVNQKNVVGDTPLHIAASWGNVEMIEALLDHGADVNAPGEHGLTPVHIAAEEDNFEAVALLIARGAHPIRSSQGQLPSENCFKGSEMHRFLKTRGY
jgi:uncharacterized protein